MFFWVLLLQPIRISDLRKVDPVKACEYFNSCFKDPSTFTVVIVGNIDPTIALPLILQYLVSWDSFELPRSALLFIFHYVDKIIYAGWNTKVS